MIVIRLAGLLEIIYVPCTNYLENTLGNDPTFHVYPGGISQKI